MMYKMRVPQKHTHIVSVDIPVDDVRATCQRIVECASTQAGAPTSTATTQASATTTCAMTQASATTSTASTATARVATTETPTQAGSASLQTCSTSTNTAPRTMSTSATSTTAVVAAPGVTVVPASGEDAPPNVQVVSPPKPQTPTSASSKDEGQATPVAPYLDSYFVRDVTLPDNTIVQPGSEVCKQWELLNNGTQAWPAGCVLAFVGGQAMGHPEPRQSVPVPEVQPGEKCVVGIDLLAPHEGENSSPDTVQQTPPCGYYRLKDPSGRGFGHRVWVQLRVQAPPPVDLALGDYAFVEAGDDSASVRSYATSSVVSENPSLVSYPTDASLPTVIIPAATTPTPSTTTTTTQPPVSTSSSTSVSTAGQPAAPVAPVMMVSGTPPPAPQDDTNPVDLPEVPALPTLVTPAAPPTPASYSVWSEQLTQLADMGFVDIEQNVVLLRQYNGNLNKVVEAHLGV
eukprot:TRINITY_DN282_c0_g1_i2.p1 TRINITY_DN282_c0_g1~~TRINITY_DN282_c0_g1_i2.p1  ORF type:complete len:459 (+),score=94.50 TRINITY_DN282_c0_g1_i2:706-2082(+)